MCALRLQNREGRHNIDGIYILISFNNKFHNNMYEGKGAIS